MEQQEQMYPVEAMSAPVPPMPHEDFYRYRIDGADIIDEMQHQLRGEIYDTKSGKWVKQFDRWLNEKGISKITHIVYSLGINKNTYLGNLTREQVLFKCKLIKKKLARLILLQHQQWEVQREMWDMLIATVVNTIHSGLSRSEGGREAQQLSTAAQRHDIYSHTEQQKESGLLKSFFAK
jgi:transposase